MSTGSVPDPWGGLQGVVARQAMEDAFAKPPATLQALLDQEREQALAALADAAVAVLERVEVSNRLVVRHGDHVHKKLAAALALAKPNHPLAGGRP